jgi:hypothetical protein
MTQLSEDKNHIPAKKWFIGNKLVSMVLCFGSWLTKVVKEAARKLAILASAVILILGYIE